MPPLTRKNTHAREASVQSVAITGMMNERITSAAGELLANNVSVWLANVSIGYFPNAVVASSVTMLLITNAAMTIARPVPE